ncbi:MAG: hypothetical protein ABIW76_17200 [Fibrobacteria bacterium]
MAIETIYDHGVTNEELKILLGDPVPKSEYQFLIGDADTEFGMIFKLYMTRGEEKKAKAYHAKIKDPEYAWNLKSVDTLID